MGNFMSGFAFVASIVAIALAWRAYKLTRTAFRIITSRKTRTVTVDMNDGKVTVIKEHVGEIVDTK